MLGLIFFALAISLTAAYILSRVLFLETAVLNIFFGAVGENLKLLAGTYLIVKKGK